MSQFPEPRRHRTNPVEGVILLLIFGVFASSIYQLLYGHPGFHPTILSARMPAGAAPIASSTENHRALASVELNCAKNSEQNVTASKVRLRGSLCDLQAIVKNYSDIKSTVVNAANQIQATVFTDLVEGRFSTDYIPLNAGSNLIQLNFSAPDGQKFSQEVFLHLGATP